MSKLSLNLEKTLPLIKNIFIPALIFGFGILSFLIRDTITPASLITLHSSFYILSFTSFLILLYFNQSKPAFFISIMILSYILINILKIISPQNYFNSPTFINLSLLVPLNLLVFYFLPKRKLLNKINVYILLILFAQYSLCEKLDTQNISLSINFLNFVPQLSGLSMIIFIAVLISFFTKMTISGNILDYNLFFVTLNILCGFYYASNSTALTIFFSSASLTIILAIIQDIYYCTYKDTLTGLASRDAYMINSKDFPLKYSIGIISIDDYSLYNKKFGRFGSEALIKMIANKITETEAEAQIYRYSDDEFVLIFKNEDKNSSFEKIERIRRAIAASGFMLKSYRKPIRLTVSASISEKKRSDSNSVEVLSRTRKALQKTKEFSQNVTTKA